MVGGRKGSGIVSNEPTGSARARKQESKGVFGNGLGAGA